MYAIIGYNRDTKKALGAAFESKKDGLKDSKDYDRAVGFALNSIPPAGSQITYVRAIPRVTCDDDIVSVCDMYVGYFKKSEGTASYIFKANKLIWNPDISEEMYEEFSDTYGLDMSYFDGCYQNIGLHSIPDDDRKIIPINWYAQSSKHDTIRTPRQCQKEDKINDDIFN